jgi:hypothetical protein
MPLCNELLVVASGPVTDPNGGGEPNILIFWQTTARCRVCQQLTARRHVGSQQIALSDFESERWNTINVHSAEALNRTGVCGLDKSRCDNAKSVIHTLALDTDMALWKVEQR